ncbi:decapping and exoribonuclease protein-like [Dendropsophus ebraccatus]|uniref:decapping and exoribonuclease protein-like n=1 Tax=Dendropsophus ebraccatus TaxID=150705 RepID=UPI003832288D
MYEGDESGRGGAYKRGHESDTEHSLPSKSSHIAPLDTNPRNYCDFTLSYTPPSELGYYSLDGEGLYRGDDQSLRYLRPPPGMDDGEVSVYWNVMDGYKDPNVSYINHEQVGLHNMLTWMKDNKDLLQGSSNERPVDYDFVTRRGILAKILCTPYEKQADWLLTVTLFKGTLYIDERETDGARKWREQCGEEEKRLIYSGFKFENYIISGSPDGDPRPEDVVNTNEAFYSVLKGQLDSHSFLVSGEVDCKDPQSSEAPPACYVELKTTGNTQSIHSNKLLKWWSQSVLCGIPLIVAGQRNQDGIVKSVTKFETSEIPEMVEVILGLSPQRSIMVWWRTYRGHRGHCVMGPLSWRNLGSPLTTLGYLPFFLAFTFF